MPIIINKDIPAFDILQKERIFVMNEARAYSQDIRPIEVAILNLMPTKIDTETQLMRLLSNSPLQVNITLISTESYQPTHINLNHLNKFYKTFTEIKDRKFDGMIITGAPVETLPFEEVKYWKELKEIFDFANKNVTSTLYICWGAQASLYYNYGIDKILLPEKVFGIFEHTKESPLDFLLKGFNDYFYIPQSRHTGIDEKAVRKEKNLEVLASSENSGIAIIKSRNNKQIFITGHLEYDAVTLSNEYERDLAKGLDIKPPVNYFKPDGTINMCWKSTATLFFTNWLNYYVYQITPYDIDKV